MKVKVNCNVYYVIRQKTGGTNRLSIKGDDVIVEVDVPDKVLKVAKDIAMLSTASLNVSVGGTHNKSVKELKKLVFPI